MNGAALSEWASDRGIRRVGKGGCKGIFRELRRGEIGWGERGGRGANPEHASTFGCCLCSSALPQHR